MVAKVLVEYVTPSLVGGDRAGAAIREVVGQPETIDAIADVPKPTAGAPAWPKISGQVQLTGLARVTVVAGAVLVAWQGADPDPQDGIRLAADQEPQFIELREGQILVFLEAADPPPTVPVAGDGLGGGSGGGGGDPFETAIVVSDGATVIAAGAAADVVVAGTVRGRAIRNRGPNDATFRVGADASGAAGERHLLVGEEKLFPYHSALKVSVHSALGTTIEWETWA